MSIRLKLSLHIIALWAVLYAIFLFYWLPVFSEQDLSRYRLAQEQVLGLMSVTVLEALSRDDLAQVYQSLDNVMEVRTDWKKLTVRDKYGSILYPLVTQTLKSENSLQQINWIQTQGGKLFVVFTLFADPQPFLAEQKYIVSQLNWLFLVLFIVSLLASLMLENKIVREPIESLIVAVGRLGDRDFSTHLPHAGNDEIGKLVDAFEDMRDRIRIHQDQLKLARDKALKATEVRDEALEATRAKSDFLAKMSHEFRTPLNAIIGYSELVSENAKEEGHLLYITDVDRIRSAAGHLLALINDLLDLSKIEAGKTEMYVEEINLNIFVDEIIQTLKPMITSANNSLSLENMATLDTVKSDPIKLRQLIFNLLSNANKFTQNGNIQITIRTDNLPIGEAYSIEVKDDGIGIHHEQLVRIFTPFTQADDSFTRKHEGIGLGLALCKQLCQIMGGSISVESVEGKGSIFTIILPIDPASETNPRPIQLKRHQDAPNKRQVAVTLDAK